MERFNPATALLLDLDGTIIGDVNAAVCEFEILTSLCPDKLSMFKALLLSQLKATMLIRPGFQAFMRAMQRREIDVFIYTASESTWARFIVPLIEQAVGVNFARPLFTRANCKVTNGGYSKPCKAILASMCTSMKKRRRAGVFCPKDLDGRVLYIDNNDVLLRDVPHAPHLVLCPTYDYRLDHDVLRLVPEETYAKSFQSIYNKLVQYELMSRSSSLTGKEAIRIMYYKALTRTLTLQRINNKQWVLDNMWATLEAIFQRHNPKVFRGKMLQYVTNKISSQQSKTHSSLVRNA